MGTKLEITPSINIKTGEVVLKVKPTLSVRGKDVIDPASSTQTFTDSSGNTVALTNAVPQVNTRTLETIAKIKSGSVLVIGGLMKDTTANSDNGVPFLSGIPVLGWFFKTISKDSAITETVILIKATIIKNGQALDRNDRDIQEKFDTNRRRFFEK